MKSRWIKLCSILLVLTMLINMLPVHALALDSEDRGSASVQGDTESHTVQIIGEVEGLREEGIKHFRLSDGSFVAVSYGLPVHFQNSGGQWIDIDNRLSLAAGAYRTANANAPAAFPSTLANGKLFTVEHGGQSVSMSLLDTTMADQMISGELDTDPEETLPAEETKAATEPIVETTAETEPSIEETVPAEPATEPETTIPAEETDVITEESLPEELPESGETEAMSGEDPENTADFAEGETEPTVSTQPTPTEKTVETQPEATETEPAETGASETEETVPALSATEETIPEETEPEETGPEDLDEATGLVFNRDVVAEVTTDTPAMLTLQDKYNWDVNDVIPQKLQSSLIYQDVFPGIDLQYTNFGYNIKEQIIINEPQESYAFPAPHTRPGTGSFKLPPLRVIMALRPEDGKMHQRAVTLLFIQTVQKCLNGSIPSSAGVLLFPAGTLPPHQHTVILHELEGHHIIRPEASLLSDCPGNGDPAFPADDPENFHPRHPSQQSQGQYRLPPHASSSTA